MKMVCKCTASLEHKRCFDKEMQEDGYYWLICSNCAKGNLIKGAPIKDRCFRKGPNADNPFFSEDGPALFGDGYTTRANVTTNVGAQTRLTAIQPNPQMVGYYWFNTPVAATGTATATNTALADTAYGQLLEAARQQARHQIMRVTDTQQGVPANEAPPVGVDATRGRR